MKCRFLLFLLLFFIFITGEAQVGIGTVDPDPDAILEVSATDRGILMPRIALSAINSSNPIGVHLNGMMVYNTATSGSGTNVVTPGLYVNNGSQWVRSSANNAINSKWYNLVDRVELFTLSDGATIRPNKTEIVIRDNGNLGIGNTTANDNLTVNIGAKNEDGIIINGADDISKAFTFDDLSSVGQGAINWRKPTANNNKLSASIMSVGTDTYSRKGLSFYTGNFNNSTADAVEKMRITPSGLIGIETGNPDAALHINQNQSRHGMNVEGIEVNYSTGNRASITYNNELTIKTTGTGDALTFDGPSTSININSKETISTYDGGIFLKTNNVTRLEVTSPVAGYDGVYIYDNSSNVTTKFTKDGLVGINTANPTEKMDIKGAIKLNNGGYTGITNGATTPVPSGGTGTMLFLGDHFYGWNGTQWRQLDN